MADVLLIRGTVFTVNDHREVIGDGAAAVAGDMIVGVGPFRDLRQAHTSAAVSGPPSDLVVPGYVNAHQHLTGGRLTFMSVRSRA